MAETFAAVATACRLLFFWGSGMDEVVRVPEVSRACENQLRIREGGANEVSNVIITGNTVCASEGERQMFGASPLYP